MARKVTFDIPEDDEKQQNSSISPARTQSRAPALSGMARSLQDAAQSSIQEISTDLIDDSEFQDRLVLDHEDNISELAESIDKQGQLIPVLLSPEGGRYKIIYGRRRLAALRLIGKPAKALIRVLNEDQAILAQGQENSFRKDLSWIEKALFARSLIDFGKDDGLVCDALNIDQKARKAGGKLTGLAHMKQVTSCIPIDLIQEIGAAPGVGRDRWYAAAKSYERLGFSRDEGFPSGNQDFYDALIESKASGKPSDKRFAIFEGLLKQHKHPALSAIQTTLGTVKVTKRSAVITIKNGDDGLHKWITDNPEAALLALANAKAAGLSQIITPEKMESIGNPVSGRDQDLDGPDIDDSEI
ncbi:ParB/RepB/Spo0J family partition protein [Loktanella sp. R86503]|uniref:ParB/RepB/Spo0J family partition protein n=1 Tax=Loktanella sp. R86503 TaxID=3093847 RepID=UPI0036DDCF65